MDNLQWFKFSPSDWMMGRVQRQSPQIQIDFLRVCCKYWQKGCELSIEDAQLEAMDSYEPLVKNKLIKEVDEKISISFLDEQMGGVNSKREQASEAGKRSAEVRKRKAESNDRSTTVETPLNEIQQSRVEESRIDEEKSIKEKEMNFADAQVDPQIQSQESPSTIEHPPLTSTPVAAINVATLTKPTRPKAAPKPKADPDATYYPHEGMNAAIQEFIRHREEIKKPMTPRAVEIMLKDFKGFTVKECMDAIKTSIVGGYQGVFPKKESLVNGSKPKDETSGPNIRTDIDYKKGALQL